MADLPEIPELVELASEKGPLADLVRETPGVFGVVLGTWAGELTSVAGSFVDGDTTAAAAAGLISELGTAGELLGLGELGVASVKAPTAARVFARQAGTVVALELDPKRPLGELETKLRTVAWAPEDIPEDELADPTSSSGTHGDGDDGARLPPPEMPDASVEPTQPPEPAGRLTSNVASHMKTVDLEEFSLPDLLEFLRNSHRTGLLMCTTPAGIGAIQLSRGMIIAADSPHALDLREHFVTHPEIDPERRRLLASLSPECFHEAVIEGVLVGRDLATPDEVERARTARIYSAFREMIVWTSGRFSFDPGVPIVTNPALALSAQSILMHLYQEQDEQDR
jgi:predicted regulator of Ras-like GTPase activity (Roadblock/LC7/MglB family)